MTNYQKTPKRTPKKFTDRAKVMLTTLSLIGFVGSWNVIARLENKNASLNKPTPGTSSPTPSPLPWPTATPWPAIAPLADLPPIATLAPDLITTQQVENISAIRVEPRTIQVAPMPALAPLPTLAPLPDIPSPPPPPPPMPVISGGSNRSGGS